MKFLDNLKAKRAAALDSKNKNAAEKKGANFKGATKGAPVKVALCLGGGGARGFAHVGALKAFEEAGLDFPLCVGTSAGSLIAAFYCAGIKSADLINYAGTINMREVHNGIVFTPNDPMKIGRLVTNLIGDAEIKNLPKQFAAVAVDLIEGRQTILDSGKVGEAVSASSAVPVFFRPLNIGSWHLVDGGLLNNIPADVARMLGADKVVTVDINPTRGGGTAETGMIDVIKATFNIMSANSSINGLRASDVVIAPDLSKFKATSKEGFQEMIDLGYKAAKAKISEIKALYI